MTPRGAELAGYQGQPGGCVRARFAEALGRDTPSATRLADTLIDLVLEAEKPGDA